jgi:DNA polymerase II large subunit
MARAAFNSSNSNPDLFKAILQKRQNDELGEVVDDSLDRAARAREERAEQDRIEREAERRARRLEYFKEVEAEDARRLREREALAEQDQREREAERQVELKAQTEADRRRSGEIWA